MRRLLSLILFPISYFLFPSLAFAGDYQQCLTNATCTIGEYLYNDDYTPLTGASCTLTAKYPDDTSFLNGVAMTGAADGWYKYDASLGATEGLYHATICCTPSSGLMCLDKTFEVKAPPQAQLTAADVWNYSTRSLTTFGSLISDLWGHSTRTLTSFGSLVTDITGIASPSPSAGTLQTIISEQKEQRELLERLVNAPIITLSLEDGETPDLSLKLEASKKLASSLYDLVQSTKARLLTLDEKWGRLDQAALTQELTALNTAFTSPSSLVTLSKSWNTPVITALNSESSQVKSTLIALLASATITKSSLAPASLFSTIDALTQMETTLGDVTSSSGDSTLFGYLASVEERDSLLSTETKKLSLILEDWDTQGETILSKRVKDSQTRVLAINEFPGGESVLEASNSKASGKAALKNLLFSLQGLVGLNRTQLALAAGAPIRGLWLEEGSIIFRAVITNPSDITTQDAQLKFFLPRELKNEDIITLDDSLSATYDTTQESLAVTGTYELTPGATKIVSVEVKDVWQLNSEELTQLKSKASELAASLQKNSLNSQGILLKGNIETQVDKLLHAQTSGQKPETRIRSYREAQLALASTKADMTQLENLVAQATSNGSLVGFVGGVGTTAVFGIILVVVAGFIFLARYFKTNTPGVIEELKSAPNPEPVPLLNHQPLTIDHAPAWQMPALIAAVVIVTAGGTLLLTRAARPKAEPVINQVIVATPTPTPVPSTTVARDTVTLSYTLTVPPDSSVNVRNRPSPDGDILMAIKESVEVVIFKESGDWRQIGFSEADKTKGYWVNAKFIVPSN